MCSIKKTFFLLLIITFFNSSLMAAQVDGVGELKGNIESVNEEQKTFVVQSITFQATNQTEYDDGLSGFADLVEGLRVEVEFEYRQGRHYATEVERDRINIRGLMH
jgi:hypothetical protein